MNGLATETALVILGLGNLGWLVLLGMGRLQVAIPPRRRTVPGPEPAAKAVGTHPQLRDPVSGQFVKQGLREVS